MFQPNVCITPDIYPPLDPPTTVSISGPDNLVADDAAVYNCSSSHSFPEPSIVWQILSEGKIHKIQENETNVKTEVTREGIVKTSKYILQLPGIKPASIIIYCIAEIKALSWKKSSDLLEVQIICKYSL